MTSKVQKILSAQEKLDNVYAKRTLILALVVNVKTIIMDLALSRVVNHVTVM